MQVPFETAVNENFRLIGQNQTPDWAVNELFSDPFVVSRGANRHYFAERAMIAARPAISVRAAARNDSLAYKSIGLAFVVIVSALFWMSFASLAGYVFGFAVSTMALTAFGTSVALFLTVVCAPIMLRA